MMCGSRRSRLQSKNFFVTYGQQEAARARGGHPLGWRRYWFILFIRGSAGVLSLSLSVSMLDSIRIIMLYIDEDNFRAHFYY